MLEAKAAETDLTVLLSSHLVMDMERIVDYLSSISWIAAMPHEEQEASIGRIRALVTHGETPSEMPVHFVIGLTSLAPPAP